MEKRFSTMMAVPGCTAARPAGYDPQMGTSVSPPWLARGVRPASWWTRPLVVAAVAAVLMIAVLGGWSPLLGLDSSIVEAVHRQALGSGVLRTAAATVTELGNTATRAGVTVAGIVLLLLRRSWRGAAFLAVVVPLGGLWDTLVKLAVDRARPVLPQAFAHAHGSSFPSGHAMGAMVTYGALLLVALPYVPPRRRGLARALVVLLVALVGSSRVVLGVHYPSDVVGGWLLGLSWLLAAGAAAGALGGCDRGGAQTTNLNRT